MGDFIITFFVSVLAGVVSYYICKGTLWGFSFAACEIITFLSCLHFIIFSSKSQYSYECPFIAV